MLQVCAPGMADDCRAKLLAVKLAEIEISQDMHKFGRKCSEIEKPSEIMKDIGFERTLISSSCVTQAHCFDPAVRDKSLPVLASIILLKSNLKICPCASVRGPIMTERRCGYVSSYLPLYKWSKRRLTRSEWLILAKTVWHSLEAFQPSSQLPSLVHAALKASLSTP